MADKLFFLFHGRFPSEKAASLFAAKDAEAFAKQGIEVQVIVPKRYRVNSQEAFDYFDVQKVFRIIELPVFDFFRWKIPSRLAFFLNFVFFSLACFYYLKKESINKTDIIYSNESLPLYVASFLGRRTFYEMHDFPESKFFVFKLFLKRYKWILIHNHWKVEKFKKSFPKIKARIICQPNAVEIKEFDIGISEMEARKKLNLPDNKKIIVYTGHLFGWKGVHVLAEAAKFLEQSYLIVFVGGTEKDVENFRKKYKNVENIKIVGFRPHKEIPIWQKAADVLVLPNTAKETISAFYTSPMKLFEYMASKRPIVASDIPSIREIVGDDSVILVKADDPSMLAQEIVKAATDFNLVNQFKIKAYEKVLSQTWDNRAKNIITFMKKND